MIDLALARAVNSLRKSRVKREIIALLVSNPRKMFRLVETAKNTQNYVSTIYGALNGLNGHFKRESSLVELGLVEVVKVEYFKLYKISSLGMRAWKLFTKMHLRDSQFFKDLKTEANWNGILVRDAY